jgi:alpha-glucosidase (family GH31 glycosyl hydrolase)
LTSGGWIGNKAQSKVAGLDPLWLINHLPLLTTSGVMGETSFVFSWGGLGNHRYPIGFSGDTFVRWSALAFQPHFTATAANVAYGWWSHDIGGHMFKDGTPELYLRWVQFGVFSPIFRFPSESA